MLRILEMALFIRKEVGIWEITRSLPTDRVSGFGIYLETPAAYCDHFCVVCGCTPAYNRSLKTNPRTVFFSRFMFMFER